MKRLSVYALLIFLLSGCGWVYAIGGSASAFDTTKAGLEVSPFNFTEQDGEDFGKAELEGEYWLADMIFTNCPSVCPTMTPNMKRLQETAKEEGVEMSFVAFTVDPE